VTTFFWKAGMATAVSMVSELKRGPGAPSAPRVPQTSTLHGDVRVDCYAWLQDRTDPDVIAHLEAENAFTDAGMEHTAALQEQLYLELLGRIKQTDLTVPWFDRGWWYYTRTEQGKAYPIHCRRRRTLEAAEEIYLDQNQLAEGQSFHALGGTEVSPDGRLLLYLEDTSGFRQYTLFVKDLVTGAVVERIPNAWTGTAWADDSRTFFYLTADAAKRGSTVWRHVLGRPCQLDEKVYDEENILFPVGLSRSKSGRYIFIISDGFTSSEVRIVPTDEPWSPPRVLLPRRDHVEYTVDHVPGMFLVCTNDGAVNFRIASLPEDDPSPHHLSDWLAHREEVFVEGIEVFRDHVVVLEREDGLRRLRVQELGDGSAAHYITFPDPAYGLFMGTNADFESEVVRFTYSSPVTPNTVYDYHLRTRTHELRKRQEIPTGFDPSRYEVRRLMVTARDGERVPVSILTRSGLSLDGSHPLLLYGYGAYGTTTEPIFNGAVLSLIDRGFLYAVAHVRGGQEMGRRWYDDGKMLRKLNTFYDFIDVAEDLVRCGYTAPDRMVAAGSSAGGLLVGAVANMRPDLFRAIVADVPFVDVVNTLLDPSLPLTAQEWEQWGNPVVEAEYRYMLQYSPYDNVAARTYPWMLVTTSLNDSQVMYWEPAKWVARLRATKLDTNPLYLRINMTGGHNGASGRYQRLREVVFYYAFMLDAVGLTDAASP
jgi:oligopeptidase B